MNARVAPVCPVSRSQPVPGQPGLKYPSIPVATDLPSAIASLNASAAALQLFFRPINNVAPILWGGPTNTDGGPGQDNNASHRQTWVEASRTTEQMRINNLDDDTLWVEVPVITNIIFVDDRGHYLEWSLSPIGSV